MAIQKKHGKGRLDKWYKLAKEKGYRARAAFKLIQLNKKYGFLEKSKVLLDLCAAPGSWCQVAAEAMPVNSLIIGVDLAPIKPIPKVITFQSDITTDKCRATIRQHIKTWKADTVLHDGAPNVGTAWNQDSFNQAELVLQAMKLATEFLVSGGTFVTKVFRSKDYNPLLWVFNQLFTKVEATKPPSSRNVSAEIFVVCRGFKAPTRIDPRFLDPKFVFAELADQKPNNEAKVYKPELKRRKREGYEDGDWTQFKEASVVDFIETTDPIAMIANVNRLTFERTKDTNAVLATWISRLAETTDEVRACCQDLKVLGRKDFQLLLKWRLKIKTRLEQAGDTTDEPKTGEEEVAEVEPMDQELQLQEELQAMRDRDDAKKKREKRRVNEKKQKEIVRMQLNMGAPMDIGMDQSGATGRDAMFALKQVDKANALKKITRGRMGVVSQADPKKDRDSGIGSSGETDSESDPEEDRLERELDSMYERYQEQKAERDAKYRAKQAREEHEDGEWEGVSADENVSENDVELEDDSSDESDDEETAPSRKRLLIDLDHETSEEGSLSKRARRFFSQDIFRDMPGIMGEAEEAAASEDGDKAEEVIQKLAVPAKGTKAAKAVPKEQKAPIVARDGFSSDSESEDNPEPAKARDEDDDWEDKIKPKPDGKPDIDIITAEAMTLAHQLATGEKSKQEVFDSGFNRYAFKDRDGLPDWFLDDESKHDKPHKPITKAAAQAIKDKLRAYNARPMKKVAEAKARKNLHAAQRLEKLRKKTDLLAAEEGMTEKEKASTIMKMLAKAAKKKVRVQPKLVVAKGVNKGIQGRPRGVKGRYKIVDARMKKELRAQKRIAKKK